MSLEDDKQYILYRARQLSEYENHESESDAIKGLALVYFSDIIRSIADDILKITDSKQPWEKD